jgi:streptomycin 6-kinase
VEWPGLPKLVDECAQRWGLELGSPYEGGVGGWVAPATQVDGTPVVLKVQFPHREAEHEADALRVWDGNGAVRLLDHDRERHALLLERCVPGTPLAASPPDVALTAIMQIVQRLSVPAGAPFARLADEAPRWAGTLPRMWETAGRPFERELVDRAVGVLEELGPSQGPAVLVNQDLHGGNVLAAEREPWLTIDPKPLVGEMAFAPTPVIRSKELGHSREQVRHRLDRCSDELGLDRERVRGWAFAHTMAWAFDDGRAIPTHIETARWLTE